MSIATGAGQRDKFVTVEHGIETRDSDYSSVVFDWQPFAQVWVKIEPLNGREYFLNRESQTQVSVRITMLYKLGITNKMRINYRGKLYQIETPIDPLEQHEELELMCSDFEQPAP